MPDIMSVSRRNVMTSDEHLLITIMFYVCLGQQFGLIERYTAAAKRHVKIPVVAKLTPNITDMVPAALAAQEGGADAISAINTVKSISHVDLDSLKAMPTIQGYSAVSGFSGASR